MSIRLLVLITGSVAAAIAQTAPQYVLNLYSNGVNFSDSKSLGHSFMVIKVKTSFGYKEEAIGFYSNPVAAGPKDLPHLIVGSEGALRSEFRLRPDRFETIVESVEIPITQEQRSAIYRVISQWNTHHYSLFEDNCSKFIGEVATELGISAPSRLANPTSAMFVKALRENYQAKLERERAAAAAPPPKPKKVPTKAVFAVAANAPQGLTTGIQVSRDDELSFQASGSWCWSNGACSGPGGFAGRPYPSELPVLLGGQNFGVLVGRIGTWMFPIGTGTQVKAQADGVLQLIFNDRPNWYGDNSGSVSVTVEHLAK